MTTLDAALLTPMLLPSWMDPEFLIQFFGPYALWGVAFVIFAECGLFPILPGDSLLFTAGALVAQDVLSINLPLLLVLLFAAAFLGDQTAYLIGRTVGPKIFDKPDSRLFKRKYIDQTNDYFEKYGGRTIVIARFVPIVRTYAPVAAGVGRMHYKHFVGFNALGALLWAVGLTWLGYLLGNITFVKDNIEGLVLLIVLLSVVPMVVEVWRGRRAEKREAALAAHVAEDPTAVGPAEQTGKDV